MIEDYGILNKEFVLSNNFKTEMKEIMENL